MIDLTGLDKADVLAALYEASRPRGMGFLQYDPKPMTREEAAGYLAQNTYFDYLKGRVMKIELRGDELDAHWYDRDNGEGAAWRAIEALRRTGKVTGDVTEDIHRRGTLAAAEDATELAGKKTTVKGNVVTLGAADVADELRTAIDRAVKKQKA